MFAIQGKVTLLPYIPPSSSMHNRGGRRLLEYPGADQILKCNVEVQQPEGFGTLSDFLTYREATFYVFLHLRGLEL